MQTNVTFYVWTSRVAPHWCLEALEVVAREAGGHWYATANKLGCGKSAPTAEAAVRLLAEDFGLRITKLVREAAPDSPRIIGDQRATLEYQLEQLVDANKLEAVLAALQTVCGEKAEHIATNYGERDNDAKAWGAAANRLETARSWAETKKL